MSEDLDTLIAQAAPIIFKNCPYYNPDGVDEFWQKFLRHYLFREICTTPWTRWQWMLRARLEEIMPKYTEIWATQQWEYKPLENINVYADGDKKADENTDFTHSGTNDWTRGLDTTTGDTGSYTDDGTHSEDGTHQDNGDSTGQVKTQGHTQTDGTTSDTTSGTSDTEQDTTGHSDSNTTTTGKTSGTSSNTRKYSDTPQSNIPVATDASGSIIMQYLTNITMDNGSTSGTSNGTDDNVTDTRGKTTTGVKTTGKADGTTQTIGDTTGQEDSTGHTETSGKTHGEGETHAEGTTKHDQTHHEDEDYGQKTGRNENTKFGHSDDWREHRVGHDSSRSYQQLVQESRDLIVEYDREIISACSDLFFQLY